MSGRQLTQVSGAACVVVGLAVFLVALRADLRGGSAGRVAAVLPRVGAWTLAAGAALVCAGVWLQKQMP